MATISQVKDLNGNLHDINAATVDGHTVASNVPANAEFTDTTYSLVGAQNTTGLIKNGSNVTSTTGLTPCPIVGGIPYYQSAQSDTSIFLTVSVPAASWVESSGVYSQTISATGVTAEMNGNIMIDIYHDSSVTTADWQNQTEAYGTFGSTGWAETGANSITLHCLEQPANDFSISIKSI